MAMNASGKHESIEKSDLEKLKILLPHWVVHNEQHGGDYGRWLEKAKLLGLEKVADELRRVIDSVKHVNEHLASAAQLVLEIKEDRSPNDEQGKSGSYSSTGKDETDARASVDIQYRSIGVIHTPYQDNAPYQPVEDDGGVFLISLKERFAPALKRLDEFQYIYVLYHIHQAVKEPPMIMTPAWAGGVKVGMFASRSPLRPNRIGLSIVKIKKIEGSNIWTSGLDAFDGTPVLDIKPYLKDLDSKQDANYGWVEGLDDYEHLLLHLKGIPHDY